MVMITSK